jgi:hypothetical protein
MTDKTEIWKDVVGYEGLYKVSNFGNVVSVKINSTMKTAPTKKGYHCICLSKNDIRYNTFVHRLVAIAFIPNPENKKQVNHKDFSKCNNNLENLEWSTQSENQKHSYKNSNRESAMKGKTGKDNHASIKVNMLSKENEIIKTFYSYNEAERETGTLSSKICLVVNGKRKTAGGYIWQKAIA